MELRPGYKQTEVGVIPKDWETSKLGDFAYVTKLAGFEYTLYFDYSLSGPVIAVRALNIKNGTLHLENIHTLPKWTSDMLPRSKLAKGDLVISYVGTLGRVAVIPEDDRFHLAPNVAKLSVDKTKISPAFLNQYLNSFHGQKVIFEAAASTTQAALSMSNLREVYFTRPPLPEQRAIATMLSDVDTLIGALDLLIAKKCDLKQATMQQLLTGQTRLPGFSGEWEVKCLGDVGTFSKGKGVRKDEVVTEGLPCIRYGEIYTHHNDYLRAFYSFITRATAKQSQCIKKGDLLFAGSGETAEEIGKCVAFLDDQEAYAGGDIVVFSPFAQNSMFCGYLINQPVVASQKIRMGQGDAVVHISARNLAELQMQLPKLDEQTAIATVLSDMDAEIAALEARRDKTRDLKQGMMQELLTGRIRLL